MKDRVVEIIVVLSLVALSGCGLVPAEPRPIYEGEIRPLSEVASISEGKRGGYSIVQIDDVVIWDWWAGGGRRTKGIHVLPGEHTLYIRNLIKGGIIEEHVVDLKAGHSYVPDLVAGDGGGLYVDVIDKGVSYNQECLDYVNFNSPACK